jgi:hypothetical protein
MNLPAFKPRKEVPIAAAATLGEFGAFRHARPVPRAMPPKIRVRIEGAALAPARTILREIIR